MGLDENLRQQRVAERRKESGFKTKKYHLFERDLRRLDMLAKNMGYDISKPLLNEEYSSIIRTCIAERYEKVFPGKTVNVPDTQIGQREYELKQIISYRAKLGENDDKIAAFLDKNGYKIPVDTKIKADESVQQGWTSELVARMKPKKMRGAPKN